MDVDSLPNPHEASARSFVDHCKNVFGWRDLDGDVIMDVGCGEKGFCGKAILEEFPNVGAIIGIDSDRTVVQNFKANHIQTYTKYHCICRNIEKKASFHLYAGKMDKVISTYVFGELVQKEEAFRNVYHLLKPGGEAAVLFVLTTLMSEWLKEVAKLPVWKLEYSVEGSDKKGADYYREMVENIGFQVNECQEYERLFAYPSLELCKDVLYEAYKMHFNIPSELLEVFKEYSFQILLEMSTTDADGRLCNRFTELSLLLTKPSERV